MIKRSLVLINALASLAAKYDQICAVFSDPDELASASRRQMEALPWMTAREIDLFIRYRDQGFAEKEIETCTRKGYSILDIGDSRYPELLKEIAHPPLILYVRGDSQTLARSSMAIVGTRLPTFYGIEMAEKFSAALAALKTVIVSGLARGIDTAAHRAALTSGRTVAVLGSGLEQLYPRENKKLAEKIAAQGAVISEFPLDTAPLKENFPRRNRIISGLSKGVIVIEAPVKSGSLITARYALEQNREVFALPGKINSPVSKGTHLLIKEGAKLVDSLEDVVEELPEFFDLKAAALEFDFGERSLFSLLNEEGMCLEEIMGRSELKREDITKALLSLQLKGIIKELKPAVFARISL